MVSFNPPSRLSEVLPASSIATPDIIRHDGGEAGIEEVLTLAKNNDWDAGLGRWAMDADTGWTVLGDTTFETPDGLTFCGQMSMGSPVWNSGPPACPTPPSLVLPSSLIAASVYENACASPTSSTGAVVGFRDDQLPANYEPSRFYDCFLPGCTAPPFQTLRLLNLHLDDHPPAGPHYCPVMGCTRSEGGKGFKRKIEMVRHKLGHKPVIYVCPFCSVSCSRSESLRRLVMV